MAKIYALNDQIYDGVENIPLLGINYLPKKIDFSSYDALIFTSKNAAYSVDSFNQEWKRVPAYVIAPKTAKEVQKLGGNVVFTGHSGHGQEFANELLKVLTTQRVLFLKAKKVLSDLPNILKENGIDIESITVYETSCNRLLKKYDIEKDSVIIFSSPSTIECFFTYFTWDESYKAVVIGGTTAKYLPKIVSYTIAEATSMEECIKKAKELLI
ncbi:uroporphyrinogen-III synthase [Candidatus Marinarcus aquaticus]|uniref:Uroporphyrinogen-III synthase n=1 Tax=Candidatus Marinarcus aquaticus TaxID=2044504 RepID=A0A4Q0XWA1_9BACT|nr:uroporphyrinogen-III synthase [Candidatus Marinarcus aquaticus]RXJ60201.1 uroporphyrinogen III synthase [Candidatus Marinarcus aquaticus]